MPCLGSEFWVVDLAIFDREVVHCLTANVNRGVAYDGDVGALDEEVDFLLGRHVGDQSIGVLERILKEIEHRVRRLREAVGLSVLIEDEGGIALDLLLGGQDFVFVCVDFAQDKIVLFEPPGQLFEHWLHLFAILAAIDVEFHQQHGVVLDGLVEVIFVELQHFRAAQSE